MSDSTTPYTNAAIAGAKGFTHAHDAQEYLFSRLTALERDLTAARAQVAALTEARSKRCDDLESLVQELKSEITVWRERYNEAVRFQ